MDPVTILIILAVILAGIVVLLGGAIRTFRRQPIVAILCLIFLFPVWLIWAFVEIFLPAPE